MRNCMEGPPQAGAAPTGPSSGVGFHVVAKESIHRIRYLSIECRREVRRGRSPRWTATLPRRVAAAQDADFPGPDSGAPNTIGTAAT